jgi:BlaI family penicillinase repressor
MSKAKLGRVQLRIMQVLWERGQATAREITEELNQQEPIAHSTVQTLLRKLEAKGSVRHRLEDRTFVFVPAVAAEKVTKGATRELIERVFAGSAAGLVAHLLKEEKIPPEELDALRLLIDQRTAKRKPD